MLGKVLKKGDTIGIIAPASCSSYEKVLEAKKNIGNMGYKVVLGECTQNSGTLMLEKMKKEQER